MRAAVCARAGLCGQQHWLQKPVLLVRGQQCKHAAGARTQRRVRMPRGSCCASAGASTRRTHAARSTHLLALREVRPGEASVSYGCIVVVTAKWWWLSLALLLRQCAGTPTSASIYWECPAFCSTQHEHVLGGGGHISFPISSSTAWASAAEWPGHQAPAMGPLAQLGSTWGGGRHARGGVHRRRVHVAAPARRGLQAHQAALAAQGAPRPSCNLVAG